MQSLRDKLLQAGLVSEEQAKKAQDDASAKDRARERPPQQSYESRGEEFRGGDRRDFRRDGPRPPRPHDNRPGGGRPPGGRGGEGRPAGGGRPQGAGRPMGQSSHASAPQGPAITIRRQPLRPGGSEAPIPKLPPMPGSKAAQRLESKKQLEQDRKLRELVAAHQVPTEPGAQTFYFVTRKGRLRRLELTEAQQKKLEAGELAVVEKPDPGQIDHALVPPEIAEQMQALSPKAVRFLNKPGAQVGFLSEEDIRSREESEKTADAEAPQTQEERHAEERAEADASAPDAAADAEASGSDGSAAAPAEGEPGPDAAAAPPEPSTP